MLENVNVLNIDMEQERLNICKQCGIYNASQQKCSSYLYINPTTNDVSTTKKLGYIKGCGCYIPTKIKRDSNHCPANKW